MCVFTTGLSNSSIISWACRRRISTILAGRSASIKMWSCSFKCSYPGLPLNLSSYNFWLSNKKNTTERNQYNPHWKLMTCYLICDSVWWSVMELTFSGSLIEPFPLMNTRQPVVASTRFNELPLGPRSRPTKLNWWKALKSSETVLWSSLHINNLSTHIGIAIYWNLQTQYPFHGVWAWASWCTLPVHCHSRCSTKSL